MTIPQVVGMYKNDRTRKEILVDFGFRLPSALDNRPLTFEEFEGHLNQAIFMSATPGPYELQQSERVVEQLVRPTGIVDPRITVRPTEGQIDDLIDRIRDRVDRGERVLVTTLTKKMAEDLADYLHEMGVKVRTCTARSTRSSGCRSCATCAWACTTCWSASTCCARASTCPR